jgi:Family of unknown function (DUF6174)
LRFMLAVYGIAVVTLAGGCTSAPEASPRPSAPATGAASPPPWTEPAKYGFVVERRCGGGPSMGRYRVSVQNGEVVRSDRIDGKTAQGEEEIGVPSLSELLQLAQTAADDGGTVSTTMDPADGHPTAVSFDVSDDGRGGAEACFTISEYAPAS